MPQKPILIYDGDCSFCKYWVRRWQQKTKDRVQYIAFQEVPENFYGISKEQFKKSVWLITENNKQLHGAAAVMALLAIAGYKSGRWIYAHVPLADRLLEFGYRIVANNRNFFYKFTKIFFKDI